MKNLFVYLLFYFVSMGLANPLGDEGNLRHVRSVEETAPSKQCTSVKYTFARANQTEDYVQYKRYFPKLKSGTVCLWFNADILESVMPLISYHTPTVFNHFLLELQAPPLIKMIVFGSEVKFYHQVEPSKNYHICGWFDSPSQTVGLYINGVNIDTKSYAGGMVEGDGSLVIGQDEDYRRPGGFFPDRWMKGTIENVVIYPRVLAQAEVQRMSSLCQCPVDQVISMSVDRVEFFGESSYSIPYVCPTV